MACTSSRAKGIKLAGIYICLNLESPQMKYSTCMNVKCTLCTCVHASTCTYTCTVGWKCTNTTFGTAKDTHIVSIVLYFLDSHLLNFETLWHVHAEETVVHTMSQLEAHQPCHTHVILFQVQVSQVLVLSQDFSQCNGSCKALPHTHT